MGENERGGGRIRSVPLFATDDLGPPVERFNPTSGHLLGWSALAGAAALVGYVVVAERSAGGLKLALAAVFAAVVVWVTQLRPRATAFRRHLVLRNALRDAVLPLAQVEEVSVGQTLNVWAGGRRYVCIGIGRSLREDLRSRRRHDVGGLGTSRMTELTLRADRAAADERLTAYQDLVVGRIEKLVAQARTGPGGGGETEAPRLRWAWWPVAALLLSGLAFGAGMLL